MLIDSFTASYLTFYLTVVSQSTISMKLSAAKLILGTYFKLHHAIVISGWVIFEAVVTKFNARFWISGSSSTIIPSEIFSGCAKKQFVWITLSTVYLRWSGRYLESRIICHKCFEPSVMYGLHLMRQTMLGHRLWVWTLLKWIHFQTVFW